MSRMRSTPSTIAIRAGFTPTVASTRMMKGMEPDGTPAVPMPPRMAMYTTMSCCPSVRSTPASCARNSTVTPS